METTTQKFHKSKGVRWRSMSIGVLAVFFAGAAIALAAFVITGSIQGNTVNYSVFGATPNSDYNVTIEHDETSQSNTYDEHSNEDGEFSGSGTPGNSQIDPGDSITVSVYDDDNNMVASISVTAPGNVQPGKGFKIYIFLWLIARLLLIFF